MAEQKNLRIAERSQEMFNHCQKTYKLGWGVLKQLISNLVQIPDTKMNCCQFSILILIISSFNSFTFVSMLGI